MTYSIERESLNMICWGELQTKGREIDINGRIRKSQVTKKPHGVIPMILTTKKRFIEVIVCLGSTNRGLLV